ncbi:alcohol acetyltransferase [Aspergillus crustosus]
MATEVDKFERLRDVGKLEKNSTARHPERIYNNVAVSANYTVPASYTLPVKDYVYKVLETLIDQHPVLSVFPQDEETEEPYFVRLPEIDLSQLVLFQKFEQRLTLDDQDSEFRAFIEKEHDTGFVAPGPYWRLFILTDNESERQFTAVFVYHHALGDGGSGSAFHRTFLKALRDSASLQQGEAKDVIIPPKTPLLPPLEEVHPLPISLPYLLKVIYKTIFPSKPNPKLWAGAVHQLPVKNQVRNVVFTAKQTSSLAKVCRANGTTVTCALEIIVARALFANVPEKYSLLTCSVPMTNRQWVSDPNITDDSMGVWVQEFTETFSRQAIFPKSSHESFPWSEAKRARQSVKRELALKGKNTSVGLFKYVKNYRKQLIDPKMGKPRATTFEVSSLGVLKSETQKKEQNAEQESAEGTGPEVEVPQVGRVVFTQSASATGAAIQFSVITGADGCLALGVSWQSGIVEDEVMEGTLKSVREGVERLL